MGQMIKISNHLAIELLVGNDDRQSALRLFLPNDPEQSFIVFSSEVHLLRDALAKAGVHLSEIEKEARIHPKQPMGIASN